MGCLECALRKKNAIIRNDTYWIAHKPGEAAYQSRTIEFLEFVEAAAIDKTSNYFAYVITLAAIYWDDAREFVRIVTWGFGCSNVPGNVFATVKISDNAAADGQGMFIIPRIVSSNIGDLAMDVGAPQVYSAHLFT